MTPLKLDLQSITSTAITAAFESIHERQQKTDALDLAQRIAGAAGAVQPYLYRAFDLCGDTAYRFLVDFPEYAACNGGCRTMHYLASLLAAAGYPVATTGLCFFDPCIPVSPYAKENDITVCCDGARVNRLDSRRNCWWMLCYGDMYFKSRVRKDECCLVYQKEFLASTRKVCDHPITENDIFYLPHIDPTWCFPGKKIIKNCVYGIENASKRSVPANPKFLDGAVYIPHLADFFPDGNRHAQDFSHQRTLAILRASENFYTVDWNTVMIVEASICGCKVWLVQPDGSAVEHPVSLETWHHEVMRPWLDVELATVFAEKVLAFFNGLTVDDSKPI